MFDELKKLIGEQFHVPANLIVRSATLEDLGLDSLDIVEFSMAVEEQLGARVSEDEMSGETDLDAIARLAGGRRRGSQLGVG